MESTVSFAVPANSLRVFRGFRNESLTDDSYRSTLGRTFMPGTPYMLAPLGLAAYLPGVVVGEASSAVPNEFAIIAYPSQQVWQQIMNDTLRGRVYNSTHGGVYDSKKSGASFPTSVKHLPALATDPYYFYDGLTDWQLGTTCVFVGAPQNQTGAAEFRQVVREAVNATLQSPAASDVDQCIVMPGDAYVVIWTHTKLSQDAGLVDWKALEPKVRTIANMRAERVVCHGEPPNVALNQTMAMNFIFLRNAEMFLS